MNQLACWRTAAVKATTSRGERRNSVIGCRRFRRSSTCSRASAYPSVRRDPCSPSGSASDTPYEVLDLPLVATPDEVSRRAHRRNRSLLETRPHARMDRDREPNPGTGSRTSLRRFPRTVEIGRSRRGPWGDRPFSADSPGEATRSSPGRGTATRTMRIGVA